MEKQKYTEEKIHWAISELKKKAPERATREQAIKLLDTFGEFEDLVKNQLRKDKKSGKLKKIKTKLLN